MPGTNEIVRFTVKHFAEIVREAGLSPEMRQIEVDLMIERLKEEHGIKIKRRKFNRLVSERRPR